MLYNRFLLQFDCCHHFDQCGFCPGVRIEDALVVIEILILKTLEWNLPLWMASLQLKKSFDRIEQSPLFAALRQQNIDDPSIALVFDIYYRQHGSV